MFLARYGERSDWKIKFKFVFIWPVVQSMSLQIQVLLSRDAVSAASVEVLTTPKFPGTRSLKSSGYIRHATISCLLLFRHKMPCALALALLKAGRSIAARIAIM